MRNTLFIALLLLCGTVKAQSQEVKDIKTQMTMGTQPGVEVFIPGADEDQVRDAIKDNTRKFRGDDERIRKSKERFIDDAKIEQLSENTVDIHYLIKKEGKGSTLQMFVNLGGVFLGRDLDVNKYNFLVNLAGQIASDATRLNYDELIKAEEKVLEDFMDDKKDALKDISKAQEDIEDAKKEIAEKENEIKELERKVSEHENSISKQQDKVKELKSKKAKVKS